MNVMENNAKSKTVTAPKVDNVSILFDISRYRQRQLNAITRNAIFLMENCGESFACGGQNALNIRSEILLFASIDGSKHDFMIRICLA